MDEQSLSSTADPFGFVRRSRQQQQHHNENNDTYYNDDETAKQRRRQQQQQQLHGGGTDPNPNNKRGVGTGKEDCPPNKPTTNKTSSAAMFSSSSSSLMKTSSSESRYSTHCHRDDRPYYQYQQPTTDMDRNNDIVEGADVGTHRRQPTTNHNNYNDTNLNHSSNISNNLLSSIHSNGDTTKRHLQSQHSTFNIAEEVDDNDGDVIDLNHRYEHRRSLRQTEYSYDSKAHSTTADTAAATGMAAEDYGGRNSSSTARTMPTSNEMWKTPAISTTRTATMTTSDAAMNSRKSGLSAAPSLRIQQQMMDHQRSNGNSNAIPHLEKFDHLHLSHITSTDVMSQISESPTEIDDGGGDDDGEADHDDNMQEGRSITHSSGFSNRQHPTSQTLFPSSTYTSSNRTTTYDKPKTPRQSASAKSDAVGSTRTNRTHAAPLLNQRRSNDAVMELNQSTKKGASTSPTNPSQPATKLSSPISSPSSVSSSLVAELRSNLQHCREECGANAEAKDAATRRWQESERRASGLESDLRVLRRKCDDLERRQSVDHDESMARQQHREEELRNWERVLEERDQTLNQKQQQLDLQTRETEAMQNAESKRLELLASDLTQQREGMEEEHAQVKDELTNRERQLQQREDNLSSRQESLTAGERRLAGWEQRLDEKWKAIQSEQKQARHQDQEIKAAKKQIDEDNLKVQAAMLELENQNSQYQAKFALAEQSLEDIIHQQREAEQTLEQMREHALEESQRAYADYEKTKQTLYSEMMATQKEHDELRQILEEKQKELGEISNKIHASIQEDRRSRQLRAKEAKEADQRLDNILGQIEVAQREKASLLSVVSEQRNERDKIIGEIQDEQRRYTAEKDRRLDEEKKALAEARTLAEMESKRIVLDAEETIEKMSSAMLEKKQSIERDLDQRMSTIESLQNSLAAASEKYKEDIAQLRRDEAECRTLRDQLNVSEGQERRKREDLEAEVERLHSIIHQERHEQEQLQKNVEKREQDHRLELQELQRRLDLVESERGSDLKELDRLRFDAKRSNEEASKVQDRLRQELTSEKNQTETRIRKLQAENENLLQELQRRLENERSAARKEVNRLNDDIKYFKKQASEEQNRLRQDLLSLKDQSTARIRELQERNDVDKQELAKIDRFLGRSEEHAVILENKLTDKDNETARLRAMNEGYKAKVEELRKLAQDAEEAKQDLIRRQQKAAILAFLEKPLRQDKERMSAAFSKWVRVTSFPIEQEKEVKAKEEILRLQNKISSLTHNLNDAKRAQDELEHDCITMKDRADLVEGTKSVLERELQAAGEKEELLRDDIKRLEEEKDQLHRNLEGLHNETLSLKQDAAELHTRLKEKDNMLLRQQTQGINEQRAQDQIHVRMEKIRLKEQELGRKEQQLAADQAKCADRHAKVEKLVAVYHKKVEQLSLVGKTSSSRQNGGEDPR